MSIKSPQTQLQTAGDYVDEDDEYPGRRSRLRHAADALRVHRRRPGPKLTPIEPKDSTIGAKPEVWARAALAVEQFRTPR
jgi:hypothetical protein